LCFKNSFLNTFHIFGKTCSGKFILKNVFHKYYIYSEYFFQKSYFKKLVPQGISYILKFSLKDHISEILSYFGMYLKMCSRKFSRMDNLEITLKKDKILILEVVGVGQEIMMVQEEKVERK